MNGFLFGEGEAKPQGVAVLMRVKDLMRERFGETYERAVPATLRAARLKFLRELRFVQAARRSGVGRAAPVSRFVVLVGCRGSLLVHSVHAVRGAAVPVAMGLRVEKYEVVVVDLMLCRLRHGEDTHCFDVQGINTRMLMCRAELAERVARGMVVDVSVEGGLDG